MSKLDDTLDRLITDYIDRVSSLSETTYPIAAVVAYNNEDEQIYGQTILKAGVPPSAIDAITESVLWNYLYDAQMSSAEMAAFFIEVYAKAVVIYEEEKAEEKRGTPPDGESVAVSFQEIASFCMEQLSALAPGIKPAVGAVWANPGGLGFSTALTEPGIEPEEWGALLRALLAPAVREGHLPLDKLAALLRDTYEDLKSEASSNPPLFS